MCGTYINSVRCSLSTILIAFGCLVILGTHITVIDALLAELQTGSDHENLGTCSASANGDCSADVGLENRIDLSVEEESVTRAPSEISPKFGHSNWVHVAIVACGDRQPETVVAVKAIVLLTTGNVFFHIFTEDELKGNFHKELQAWPQHILSKFSYKLYPITFPPDKFSEWKKLFKTCAAQRLFIPNILTDVDSLLYLDTDILVLRPVQDIWSHFFKFNSSQLAAVAPEHESPQAGWYNRFARHPYYGSLGINSGVMLMNLTRIRQFAWLDHINRYYATYKYNITWGDQDLLNILFHYYPEFVYVYDCSWNYRPDHCMYMSVCKTAENAGISVLHGNRGTLHNDKQPVFRAMYRAIREHDFNDGAFVLLNAMEKELDATPIVSGSCRAVKHIFTKTFRAYV